MQVHADSLSEHGYSVIRVFDTPRLAEYATGFFDECLSFPEYKRPEVGAHPDGPYVMGGFGAFGNPASFHNPTVRLLRLEMYNLAKDLFSHLSGGRHLEALVDRMSWRRPGTDVTAETWHRDESSGLEEGDSVFGGWINLDTEPQYFLCAPGSHFDHEPANGFAQIGADEAAELDKQMVMVEIPPGHWIVFYQNIAHQVASIKKTRKRLHLPPVAGDRNSIRLYLGWRLTHSTEPLYQTDRIIDDQGIFPLPSGQFPPMYSMNHMVYTRMRTAAINWSLGVLKEQCIEERTIKRTGEKYRIAHRFMKSLRELGLPLYPPYMDEERAILRPRKI